MIKIDRDKKVIKISFFTFIIYLLLLLSVEGLIYTFIGIGLLSFLGFQYESYISVFIFFIVCYILMMPTDYLTIFLLSLFRSKSQLSRFQERCIDFIVYTSLASLIIGLVDFFSSSISISPTNQVLFVLLCYMLQVCSEYLFYKKK